MMETVIVRLDHAVIPDRPNKLFLTHIEWWENFSRFAVVKYILDGSFAELGLRVDLDKRVFLDLIGDDELDEKLREIAPDVCDIVAKYRTEHPVSTFQEAASSFRQAM